MRTIIVELSQYVLEVSAGMRSSSSTGASLEPARFTVQSPPSSCIDAASAGDPKKDRTRILVEG
jgi:hypothetical protein